MQAPAGSCTHGTHPAPRALSLTRTARSASTHRHQRRRRRRRRRPAGAWPVPLQSAGGGAERVMVPQWCPNIEPLSETFDCMRCSNCAPPHCPAATHWAIMARVMMTITSALAHQAHRLHRHHARPSNRTRQVQPTPRSIALKPILYLWLQAEGLGGNWGPASVGCPPQTSLCYKTGKAAPPCISAPSNTTPTLHARHAHEGEHHDMCGLHLCVVLGVLCLTTTWPAGEYAARRGLCCLAAGV